MARRVIVLFASKTMKSPLLALASRSFKGKEEAKPIEEKRHR
jgi:hypothetical protein